VTRKDSKDQSPFDFQEQSNDDIDLKQTLSSLIRHKKIISKITAVTFVFTGLFVFTQKPLWEGHFQIVLQSKGNVQSKALSLLQGNPDLSNLIGLGGQASDLETEVQILESPSVLKPIYDFVKAKKSAYGEDTSDWRYVDWVEDYLTIELERGTSVLNLAYRDTDKELILPVMNQISKAYQNYSGRDRERGISLGIDYLNKQINEYQKKSINSSREAQDFSIKYDLTARLNDGGDAEEAQFNFTVNIEVARIQAANLIRNIDEQLKQLDEIANDPEALMFFGRNIPALATQELAQKLDALDADLAILRSKYRENDDSIRLRSQQRLLLIDLFKRQTYGYLYAQRAAAKAQLAATERPKDVLIKYRELLRNAFRDEATLTRLETEQQLLSLEQARKEDPWELISTPTLLDKPVAPRKLIIMVLGLLAGLTFGGASSLIIDRRSGLIFSKDELKNSLPFPLLIQISSKASETWKNTAELLCSGSLSDGKANSAIGLIPLGKVPQDVIENFSADLRRALNGRELVVSTTLLQTSQCSTRILLTSTGVLTRSELSLLNQELALQNTPVEGWVLIDT